jgi:chromosome segregation ATPase
VHPDLLLDLASWISPAAYVRASGIVKNFLVREKEDQIRRLSGDKCRLEKMFEDSDKRREEAEKRAEQMLIKMTLQNEQTHIKLDNTEKTLENTNIKLDNTEKTLENTNIKLDNTEKTLENTNAKLGNTEKTLEQTNLSLESTNVKLDNTEKILEKTHIKLDKTKKTLERVEARVELLVDEVVPPAKKVSLHEQFGIMKLNDSDGKREYKVYCVQKRGVLKARASIMKEYPNAVLIKEVNPNANSKNFLHKLKERYGTGKKSKIQVSYNFVNLKEGGTEEQLKEMTAERPPPLVIDDVVDSALNYGVN